MLTANFACLSSASKNCATAIWNAPVPASSTKSDTCIGAVAGLTSAIARSFPPSLTVRSAAVKSVTAAPFASIAEKYIFRSTSGRTAALPGAAVTRPDDRQSERREDRERDQYRFHGADLLRWADRERTLYRTDGRPGGRYDSRRVIIGSTRVARCAGT